MPFIPNELDAFHASQSSPDSGDFDVLRDGAKATGVVSGGAVTAQGTPDMTVAVATAVIAVAGARANVTAGNVTITTAHATNPRIDLIVASSAGVKSAVAGTPAPEMAPGVRGPAFPAIPANSVVLAAVYVPATDTTIAANQITDKRVFVIPPEPTTNYDLAKARSIPLVKERGEVVTLDTDQFQIHDLQLANGKLFGTTRTTPAWFIRFNNLDDLTDRTAFQFDTDGFHNNGDVLLWIPEKQKFYVMFDNSTRILVSEVDPVTHAVTNVINDTSRVAGTSGDMASDGTHLYVFTYTSPAKVVKYQLSDFAFVAENTLTGLNSAHCAIYDGVSLFAGSSGGAGWIAKVNPADLTYTSANFPAGITNVTHPGFASDGDYLFIGIEGAAGAGMWRMDKSDLSLQAIPGITGTIHAVHFDGRFIWGTRNTSPGQLIRVDPSNFNDIAFHTFATGENHAYAMASDGQRMFIVFWLPNPGKVRRFVPSATSRPVIVQYLENAADVTTGSTEQTLLSSIVTGFLSTDKKGFRVTATGTFAANSNNKRVLLKIGLGAPVAVFDTGSLAFNDVDWWLEAICTRTGANAQKWVSRWMSGSSLLATKVQRATTTQTDTATLNLLVRGQGVSDNDVTNENLLVEQVS